MTPAQGDTPGATIANQVQVRVKVKGIDKELPMLTVVMPDGTTMPFMVKDKKRLDS